MKRRNIGFLLLVLPLLVAGCATRNAQKNEVGTRQIGYYEDVDRKSKVNVAPAPVSEEDYAKWGKLALQETKKKYPNSKVSDYRYDTRRINPDGTVIDFFNFIVTENAVTKDVRVSVMHDPDTDRLISITFEERG
ncbi:DUF3889 domain-containing protein [Fictibacillus sp. Mic-4]|uniref:DUF3889 domain-containing protein n=1 Tax=Fictibacillus TaxID=1329200 RepID=UPI0003FA66BB|nr:DUF3889 domain-containing protein [Fictibacillus gelatini]